MFEEMPECEFVSAGAVERRPLRFGQTWQLEVSKSEKKWEVEVTYVDHLQAAKPCSCHWVLRICVFVSMFSYSFAPTSRAQHFLEMTKMVVGNCFKFHLLGGFVKSCVF